MGLVPGPGIRLRVYLAEADVHGERPLYAVLLERLRLAGASGACVLNGLTGFGRASVASGAPLKMSSDIPIVVEVIDAPAREAALVAAVREVAAGHLITVDRVGVVG